MSIDPAETRDSETPVDPDQANRDWFEKVYQGDTIRQLSIRSIVSGMLIGGLMSISNLYVGLKTGWGLNVTVTSCILAFGVFKLLELIYRPWRKDHFTVLENYTMSSAASAAGYIASAGLTSAFPALLMITGRELTTWEAIAWLISVSMLGVFMAIPLKRQLINIDQLPFPEGMATAQTLKSMHTEGTEAIQKAKALVGSAALGGLLAFWNNGCEWVAENWKDAEEGIRKSIFEFCGKWSFPESIPLSLGLGRFFHSDAEVTDLGSDWLKKYSIGVESSFLMIAAGAIMGIRVGVSLLLGAVVYFGILGPLLLSHEIIKPGAAVRSWTLWPATSLMVASGLLSFALRWKTAVRAFSGLASIIGAAPKKDDPLEKIEVPGSWFAIGTLISGLACIVLGQIFFQIPWWMGLIAVILTFLLSIVAARATGETSITPIGAMGKITQLTYGVLAPQNPTTNLMTASITAGAASHAGDLLTDLKAGYMLGGNPRAQTISQLFGVVAGAIVSVPVYRVIVSKESLTDGRFAAPAAKVWQSVAELLSKGIAGLPEGALLAMVLGAIAGVVITLLDEFLPKKYRVWVPSATALGIAGVLPGTTSISMFLGAFIAWIISKASPSKDEKYTVPIASGLIAGESLMGVVVKLADNGPKLFSELFGGSK